MKTLPIILLCALIGIGGYYTVGPGKLITGSPKPIRVEELKLDSATFYASVQSELKLPDGSAKFPARSDEVLSRWLEKAIGNDDFTGRSATESLLEKLSSEVPQISTATACVAHADSIEKLHASISGWAGEIDSGFTHFSTYLFVDQKAQMIGCAALAVERLKSFSPMAFNSGEKSFYSVCRLCDRSHIGTIEQTHGAAALSCPHCNRNYELLVFKMNGDICRANELLTGWQPPARVPTFKSKVNEMLYIWGAVLKHVRYAKDFEGYDGNLDTWQTAEETWEYKNGDCEDSSILLAQWLIGRGFNARVVIGTTDEQAGHAWCVVNLEGTSYLLETTDARPDVKHLPYASKVGKRYLPRYQFNQKSILYLRDERSNPRYWSDLAWLQIDAE